LVRKVTRRRYFGKVYEADSILVPIPAGRRGAGLASKVAWRLSRGMSRSLEGLNLLTPQRISR